MLELPLLTCFVALIEYNLPILSRHVMLTEKHPFIRFGCIQIVVIFVVAGSGITFSLIAVIRGLVLCWNINLGGNNICMYKTVGNRNNNCN